MNAGTMAFVRKEDPEGTYGSFKIFVMQTILIHTFSRLLAAFSLKIRLVHISASPIEM